jgi:alkanesulfonate monooxygenase SsuD/methylene tetrahydromethanopterin reductase-like flavin-dependent oxidoreductase (luciferase family)
MSEQRPRGTEPMVVEADMPIHQNPHTTPRPSHTAGKALSFLASARSTGAASTGRLQATVQLFELAETLGYDRGWLRQDGDEPSAASAVTVLSAIGQRTRAIGLGAAVLPCDQESPTGLATALATLDDLTAGRVHTAVSARAGRGGDPARSRVLRVHQELVRRAPVEGAAKPVGARLWHAAVNVSAARWAAEQGLGLLATDDVHGLPGQGFAGAQQAVLRAYREVAGPTGRTAVARVLLPTDSADQATRSVYLDLADSRVDTVAGPLAPASADVASPLAGSSWELVEQLAADVAVGEADELVVLLPVGLTAAAHAQILHDVALYVAPEAGFGVDAVDTAGDQDAGSRAQSLDSGEPAEAGRAA